MTFVPRTDRPFHLTPQKRSAFLMDMRELLRAEFGEDCVICKRDALALSVFMKGPIDPREARHLVRRIRRQAMRLMEKDGLLSALHIGFALAPDHARTFDDLSRKAALALNCAERDGRNDWDGRDGWDDRAGRSPPDESRRNWRLCGFSPALQKREDRRLRLADDWPDALKTGQICAWFQPVMAAASGRIIGFEALVRWNHPRLGLVCAPEILALAEQGGHMHRLTAHMLGQSARQARFWPEDVKFAVNVTPSQLTPPLVDLVRETIRDADIDPARLEIEVTEDALIHDFAACAKTVSRLRALGVSIAMDDFGAGYASINNLRLLNFDKIKIDKSICDGLPFDERATAIVRSIMYMARELNASATAEGIEKEEQLSFLRPFDCGVQGFIFSKALSSGQLSDLRRSLPQETLPQ